MTLNYNELLTTADGPEEKKIKNIEQSALFNVKY